MKPFFDALKFVRSSIWQDDCKEDIVLLSAQKAFFDASKNCTFGRRFFRLAGQSGSGKTSQLYFATNKFCKSKNIRPIHIAVRNYAHFYPGAEKIPKSEFRERTNGFSLKVLLYVLKMAFESGADIILEIALLDKKFEKFIIFMLKRHNFLSIFQILSVNKLIADAFLIKRKLKSGRNTLSSSSAYFYKVMKKSLKYVSTHYSCPAIVWSVFELDPIYFGDLKNCYPKFVKNLKRIDKITFSEQQLREAKFNFLSVQFRDGIF